MEFKLDMQNNVKQYKVKYDAEGRQIKVFSNASLKDKLHKVKSLSAFESVLPFRPSQLIMLPDRKDQMCILPNVPPGFIAEQMVKNVYNWFNQ